jgi:hypothetical protein
MALQRWRVRHDTKQFAGELLTRIGARCSPTLLHQASDVANFLAAGRWMRQHGFTPRRVRHKNDVFAVAAADVKDERVLYLEFGVAGGWSLRWWSESLRNPEARLDAFDSFLGLPETWNGKAPKGTFSTGGVPPEIDDPRVRFVVGWFADTLPDYEWPEYDRLVVNCDSDLYASTALVLDFVGERLRPGDYLYFDDLTDQHHEQKAVSEFLEDSGIVVEAVAATRNLNGVLFRVVEPVRSLPASA